MCSHQKGMHMERILTVHYECGRRYSTVPMIRMRGRWLESAGFRASAKYRVEMLNIGALLLRRITDGESTGDNRRDEERVGSGEKAQVEIEIRDCETGSRDNSDTVTVPDSATSNKAVLTEPRT